MISVPVSDMHKETHAIHAFVPKVNKFVVNIYVSFQAFMSEIEGLEIFSQVNWLLCKRAESWQLCMITNCIIRYGFQM